LLVLVLVLVVVLLLFTVFTSPCRVDTESLPSSRLVINTS